MAIKIENPAEAFAAIASVVIAADSEGSLAERDAVLQRLKATGALANNDGPSLSSLLARVTKHLCDGLPVSETGSFTPAAVAQVIAAVKPVLDVKQRGEALRLAEVTMTADDATDSEQELIAQLRAGLTG